MLAWIGAIIGAVAAIALDINAFGAALVQETMWKELIVSTVSFGVLGAAVGASLNSMRRSKLQNPD